MVFSHFSLPLHSGNWGNKVLFLFSHNKNTIFCSNCQLFTSSYFLNHLPTPVIAPPVTPEPIAPPATPEPIAAPITHSPAISQSTTTSVESTHTFSTVDPLSSTNPLVPQTITTTSEEATYHKEPTPTYQTPINSTLQQEASQISNEEALERARRIIEKYKK